MLSLQMLIGWVAPAVTLLSREKEEPSPGSEPPLVETPERWGEFYRELSRARRHERTFAIARIPITGDQESQTTRIAAASSDGESSVDGGDGPEQVADRLRASVRMTDHVWVDGGSAFVLMPESGRDEAAAALPRAAEEQNVNPSEQVTVASFPEDGITSGAVLAALLRPEEADAAVTAIDDEEPTEIEPVIRRREAG